MKKEILKYSTLSLAITLFVACKNHNTVETTDAQDVVEKTETSTAYTVNTEASKIDWEGSKPTGTHTGYLNVSQGEVHLDENNLIESGEFELDLASITVTDLDGEYKEKLEAHLKGTANEGAQDFFNITQYSNGNFSVTGVREADGKTYLQGNLTLKETTKNIEFPVNVSLEGDKMILQSEKFYIDRTQWGINYQSKSVFADLGDKFINDDIALVVYVEALKK